MSSRTQTQQPSIFNSSDSGFWRSQDLTALFGSSDGETSPGAQASRPRGLDSNDRSLSQAYVAKLVASRDSFFASIDMMPFQSLDSVTSAPPPLDQSSCGELMQQGIFESREWLKDYVPGKESMPVDTAKVFATSELPPMPPLAVPFSTSSRASSGSGGSTQDKYMNIYKSVLLPQKTKTTPTKKPVARAEKKGSTCSRRAEPKVKVYVEPRDMDILCGRGGRSNKWKGNERYREVVEEAKPLYNVSAKYEKTLLSQQIVESLKKEGRRFIKQDPKNKKWYVVPDIAARRKAGQALREENTPESRLLKREKYGQK